MFDFLKPDLQIASYQQLDVGMLQRSGIELLICDIDNTLAVHDEKLPGANVSEFVRKVQAANLKFCLISNNREERVRQYGEALGEGHMLSR